MAIQSVAPTKSNLLALGRQLSFAEEGYDLLEQKRQILVYELLNRLNRARQLEQRLAPALALAFAALREATLDAGAVALAHAGLAVRLDHRVALGEQHLMGLRLPRVAVQAEKPGAHFGVEGVSANADEAMRHFAALLPLLGELAELEHAVRRLARELRKTQRRCNALIKLFIPDCRDTIAYIRATLEEREREAFTLSRMIRDRLARDR